MKIHSKLNKFRIKNTRLLYVVSDLRFLLEIQGILPGMTVLSSFFKMFIVLGMYNFAMCWTNMNYLLTIYYMIIWQLVSFEREKNALRYEDKAVIDPD